MPIYEYQGQQYEMSTEDPQEAKNRILGYLGKPIEEAEKPSGILGTFAGGVGKTLLGAGETIGVVEPETYAKYAEGFKSSEQENPIAAGLGKGVGGIDAYMKNREASKLNQMVNQNAPMSYQQFEQQYSDPNAYKLAANQMARSGRTGTLPVLLARMRNATRGKYAGYLPGAQQQHLENKAAVGNMRQGALGSLFRPVASLDWSNT